MAFQKFELTNDGINLLAQVQAELGSLNFTKIKIGSGVYAGDIKLLTDVITEFHNFPVTSTQVQPDKSVKIQAPFDNSTFTQAYSWREIGIFAKLGETGTEILYSYSSDPTPDTIPDYDGGLNKYRRTLDIRNYISDVDSVTLEIVELTNKYDFNTVAEMVAAAYLVDGDRIKLWGFNTLNDGRGHERVFSNTDDGSGIPITSGGYANLLIKDEISYWWFEGMGDEQVCSAVIQKALDYCATNNIGTLKGLNTGNTFLCDKTIVITSVHSNMKILFGNEKLKYDLVATNQKFGCIGVFNKDDLNTNYHRNGVVGIIENVYIDCLDLDGNIPTAGTIIDSYMDDLSIVDTATAVSQYLDMLDHFSINFPNNYISPFFCDEGGTFDYTNELNDTSFEVGKIKVKNSGLSGISMIGKYKSVKIGDIETENCPQQGIGYSYKILTDERERINIEIGSIKSINSGAIYDFTNTDKTHILRHGNIKIGKAIGEKIRLRSKIHGSFNTVEIDYQETKFQLRGEDKKGWAELNILMPCDEVRVGAIKVSGDSVGAYHSNDFSEVMGVQCLWSGSNPTKLYIGNIILETGLGAQLFEFSNDYTEIDSVICNTRTTHCIDGYENSFISIKSFIRNQVGGAPAVTKVSSLNNIKNFDCGYFYTGGISSSVFAIQVKQINISTLKIAGLAPTSSLFYEVFSAIDQKSYHDVKNLIIETDSPLNSLCFTQGNFAGSVLYVNTGNITGVTSTTKLYNAGDELVYYKQGFEGNRIIFTYPDTTTNLDVKVFDALPDTI